MLIAFIGCPRGGLLVCEAEYAAVAGSTRGKEDSALVSNHTTAPHWANLMNTFEGVLEVFHVLGVGAFGA